MLWKVDQLSCFKDRHCESHYLTLYSTRLSYAFVEKSFSKLEFCCNYLFCLNNHGNFQELYLVLTCSEYFQANHHLHWSFNHVQLQRLSWGLNSSYPSFITFYYLLVFLLFDFFIVFRSLRVLEASIFLTFLYFLKCFRPAFLRFMKSLYFYFSLFLYKCLLHRITKWNHFRL